MNIKDWVKKNLDKDQIKEVVEYGCVNGTVNELIYYSDTSAFHDAHEEEIWEMVYESAEGQGLTVLEFLATLRGGLVGSMYQLKNLLAWFAVEETCFQKSRLDIMHWLAFLILIYIGALLFAPSTIIAITLFVAIILFESFFNLMSQ